MKIDLSGKRVLVTGGSRGIGAAATRAFAAAGARVAVHCGRQLDVAHTLAAEIGLGAQAFQADLAEAVACQALWDEVVTAFGRIDVLVNNAGVATGAPLDGTGDAWLQGWSRTMAVNLTAVGLLCREAVRHFQAHGGGRIITISSRAAFRGDTPEYLAYAASKGGVVALTRSIARGFGKHGIMAFDVAPGFTRTEMAQAFIDRYGEAFAAGDIALSRLTEPGDIAPMLVLLASGLADHATGTTIDINAGSYVH
jgi:NAD(P)-dependent dehydrogenase (short-subunit alcohol dehydrogenase family)